MPHKFPNVKPDQSKTRTKEIDQITPTYLIQTIFDSSLLPPPLLRNEDPRSSIHASLNSLSRPPRSLFFTGASLGGFVP